jgi:hypothetical protein
VADRRLGGRTLYWKLRFRFGGRLRTIYVGDAAKAARVQAELDEWQAARASRRERARWERAARATLRESKARLRPVLERIGFFFHGDGVRRRRPSTSAVHS